MTDALVTGATGFLGGHLVEALVAAGKSVRVLCRQPNELLQSLRVEFVQGDIRDIRVVIAACRGVRTVYHAAAKPGVWGPWQDYFSVNVTGARNVIAACKQNGVPRLVFTSSPSVTFSGDHQRGANEQTPYPREWLAHYPHTKAIAESEVLEANAGALRTCSLRPHLIWGPRDNHLIPRLIERAKQGRLRIVGSGHNLVDNVYVANAAHAHLLADAALERGVAAGKSYFISQGEPVRCWDWINQILAMASLPPVARRIPFAAAYAAGAALEAAYWILRKREEPRMTRFLAAQLAKDHYFDISAAQNDLGYFPVVSLQEGMSALGAWLRSASGPRTSTA